MPASIWPVAILLATMMALSSDVPQARAVVMPGVVGARPELNSASRARFQSTTCLMTAPKATSPNSRPCNPKRSTSAPSTFTDMPKLPTSAYAVLCRQNGMRVPPMTATRLDIVSMVAENLLRGFPMMQQSRCTRRFWFKANAHATGAKVAVVNCSGFIVDRIMQSDDLVSCPGVLAWELTPGETPNRLSLERDEADALAGFMADDLRALLPGIEEGRLAVVGAHFDSTELLRPGFPVFTTLDNLAARMDGGVLAFGSRDGHMPAEPLVPENDLAGGALRLIPWTVMVNPQLAETLGPMMETELV